MKKSLFFTMILLACMMTACGKKSDKVESTESMVKESEESSTESTEQIEETMAYSRFVFENGVQFNDTVDQVTEKGINLDFDDQEVCGYRSAQLYVPGRKKSCLENLVPDALFYQFVPDENILEDVYALFGYNEDMQPNSVYDYYYEIYSDKYGTTLDETSLSNIAEITFADRLTEQRKDTDYAEDVSKKDIWLAHDEADYVMVELKYYTVPSLEQDYTIVCFHHLSGDIVDSVITQNSNEKEESIRQSQDQNTTDHESFTNQYGSSNTKCAHAGCNNPIASSGDTNCCTIHSSRCLNCNAYIDEDAMYCMDCIESSYSNKSSGSSTNSSGANGYDMPNEEDESFSDYIKRVDPELYDDLQDAYNDATGQR